MRFLIVLFCAVSLFSQAPDFVSTVAGAGANLQGQASPAISGDIFYAKRINDQSLPLFSYSDTTINPERLNGSKFYVLNTKVQTGLFQTALRLRHFLFGFIGEAGAAAGGQNFGYAASVGVGGFWMKNPDGKGLSIGTTEKFTKTSINTAQVQKFGLKVAWGW